MLAFYNGEFIDSTEKNVSLEDRAYNFGDGVYEVIRVYDGKPFMLEEHMDRLQNSAKALHIPLPYTSEEFITYIYEGIKRLNVNNIDIYLQITRGESPRNHIYPKEIKPNTAMIFRESKQASNEIKQKGASVIIKEDERWANCYIKSLNLLPNILARNEAAENGCVEAILVKGEQVTEGSASNVFVIKNGELYTTPLYKGILSGITRKAVLTIANTLKIKVHEQFFTEKFLLEADECFITSTTSEVMPITMADNKKINKGKVGSITENIMEAFNQFKSK
jgi:D-alanine transaminase